MRPARWIRNRHVRNCASKFGTPLDERLTMSAANITGEGGSAAAFPPSSLSAPDERQLDLL